MYPFEMENDIALKIGGKPKSVSKQGQSKLIMEVSNKGQSTKMQTLIT